MQVWGSNKTVLTTYPKREEEVLLIETGLGRKSSRPVLSGELIATSVFPQK